MPPQSRHYRRNDFMPIRDMLSETFRAFPVPVNWRIERWNYARYLVAPYLAPRFETNRTPAESDRCVGLLEGLIRVWEDATGRIVAVVLPEHCWPGEAFILRRPEAHPLLPELVADAMDRLTDPVNGEFRLHVPDHDDALASVAKAVGLSPDPEQTESDCELDLSNLPGPGLQSGYRFMSMAETDDLRRRCAIYGLGFNHRDPADWCTPYAYAQMQRAPDYRADLDLVVVAPDGEWVSCCIVWMDSPNRIAVFEHVATHMDHRRKGLGREVVFEGARRAAVLGATSAWVGSAQAFYLALGFKRRYGAHKWIRAH